MIITEFNVNHGLYIFQFTYLETDFHSHPAIEIITAVKGAFTLWTETKVYRNLAFAVLAANQKHKLSSTNCEMKVIMIEHHNRLITEKLAIININLTTGYYQQIKHSKEQHAVDEIIQLIKEEKSVIEYDERITSVLHYLRNNDVEYSLMLKTLQSITNLSESRLSHLFKANIGISLKKYLIWTKIKSTIKQHLNNQEDLISALIKSGFYDQPHFSKSFKNMLGVKPSKAYNSRSVQVLR